MKTSKDVLKETPGAFAAMLLRSNRTIRDDRALTIVEDARLLFRRKIEDLDTDIRRAEMDRDGLLDLSPTNAQSLILASDFKADQFVEKDLNLGTKIRQLRILKSIAQMRYDQLFGGAPEAEVVDNGIVNDEEV